jgi:hypothetical protein
MQSLYALFQPERDEDPERNGPDLDQELAPPMDGFWFVNFHLSPQGKAKLGYYDRRMQGTF